jgi:hypothetical protein
LVNNGLVSKGKSSEPVDVMAGSLMLGERSPNERPYKVIIVDGGVEVEGRR